MVITQQTFWASNAYMHGDKAAATDTTKAARIGAHRQTFGAFGHGSTAKFAARMSEPIPGKTL
jgi:hypothetical protein